MKLRMSHGETRLKRKGRGSTAFRFSPVTSDIYFSMNPANRKKIERSGCRTSQKLLIIARRVQTYIHTYIRTCVAARRRSNPPQSVPLEASCTDPISRRVNPASPTPDFCRPSSKELLVSRPTAETMASSSSSMLARYCSVPESVCSTVCSFDVPLGIMDETTRKNHKRITAVVLIIFGKLGYYYSLLVLRRLYTPAAIVQTVWFSNVVRRALLRLLFQNKIRIFAKILVSGNRYFKLVISFFFFIVTWRNSF